MIARVVEPPVPIVTWQEAKDHLRVEDGEQVYVEGLIAAAQGWLDGPDGWLGHCFGLQIIDIVGDFPDGSLPLPPIIEVVSIVYRDGNSVEQTMPSEDYRLLRSGAIYAQNWPTTDGEPEAVTIRVTAGYAPRLVEPEDGGDAVEVSTVPAAAKQAVLLIVGHWYENREAVVVGDAAAEVPVAAQALLAPFRSWRA
ncbi:MAG TPA: head-tail connector protein [Devosia sp.]|nr:head-tail connector protein [Devosia sp.]